MEGLPLLEARQNESFLPGGGELTLNVFMKAKFVCDATKAETVDFRGLRQVTQQRNGETS